MRHKHLSTLFCCVGLLLALTPVRAQQRALLFSKTPSEPLQKVVDQIRDRSTPVVDATKLTWSTRYFARIAPRAAVFTPSGWLQDSAIPGQSDPMIGTRPFVFLTSPESLYGRSLLQIYEDIGYEAEDILASHLNEDMVAIVFRYPAEVVPTPEITDGHLPADWNNRVYVPLWDNSFALFHQLAREAVIEPGQTNPFAPTRLFFDSNEEKAFALAASTKPNPQLKNSAYTALKARGGDDWRYRQLLENKLSLFEHFRGTGRTQNEVADPNGTQPGLVEFVGPNRKLKDLPEVAIVDLGRLTITNP